MTFVKNGILFVGFFKTTKLIKVVLGSQPLVNFSF